MYGITLILTLAVVGGAIAYIGDKIGMRVGRKKLTLFGLRPKHTGIVVTICTGVFIAAASIGVLSIASQDVRTALFSMKQIQQDLEESQHQLALSTAQVEQMQGSYNQMKDELSKAAEELDKAEQNLHEAETARDKAMSELKWAQDEVKEQESRIVQLSEQSERLQQSVQELRQTRDELVVAINELSQEFTKVASYAEDLERSPFVYQANQIIASRVFKAGESFEDTLAKLQQFLTEVDKMAASRGGGPNPDSAAKYRAIYTFPTLAEMLAQRLHEANDADSFVVRAVSQNNTIPGIPVVVYFEAEPDELVFREGFVIAEAVWNPAESPQFQPAVFELLNQANREALKQGMHIEDDGTAIQLPGGAFLAAVQRAGSIEGEARIRLIVSEDAWRANPPVILDLEITPR